MKTQLNWFPTVHSAIKFTSLESIFGIKLYKLLFLGLCLILHYVFFSNLRLYIFMKVDDCLQFYIFDRVLPHPNALFCANTDVSMLFFCFSMFKIKLVFFLL